MEKKAPSIAAMILIAGCIFNLLLTGFLLVELHRWISNSSSIIMQNQGIQMDQSKFFLGGKITPLLAVKSLALDGTTLHVTFCNNGNIDALVFPVRLRLNGINRDFEIGDAHTAHACVTRVYGIDTWGLNFAPGSTLTALAIIDPDNIYGGGNKMVFPAQGSTFTVPIYPGPYLSVRSILLKSGALQATFCNLGTLDLNNFPVLISLNTVKRSFNISAAEKIGKCATMSWPFSEWGVQTTPGQMYTATILLDPDNTYQETNKYDDAATITGIP